MKKYLSEYKEVLIFYLSIILTFIGLYFKVKFLFVQFINVNLYDKLILVMFMKKRILIPYATYGSGHKSTALYIKDYFENT